MDICEFLTVDRITLDLGTRTKPEVIGVLARTIAASESRVDGASLESLLAERELQSSTAFGDGIAIPHARCAGLVQPTAALARSVTGVDFDSVDGRPTHLFFAIVSPADNPGPHLKLLSRVSRILANPVCRARLMQAGGAPELLALLSEEDDRQRRQRSAA